MRILALAGLPGTGKSALARALGRRLGAPVLDKDLFRRELWGELPEYSAAQNDAAARASYEAARRAFAAGAREVVLDGRTYARRVQVEELTRFAGEVGAALVWIELRCAPAEAKRRIECDRASGAHLAPDRTSELYDRLATLAEPLEGALALDSTSAGPDELALAVIGHLRATVGPDAARS
jgi:predicted kinase